MRYSELDELMQLVETYYYQEPDTDAMIEMAERGLLAGLGDLYTYYYNPQEYADMWADDEGEYGGVGIQISSSYETLVCTISRVFADTPAERAGLRKGDVLLRVEDIDVNANTLNDAVALMRGTVDTSVHIQVQRKDELLDFDVPRAIIHVNWVSSKMLDEQTGLISLYEFSGNCATAFTTQLDALRNQGLKGLIIDLRDNPGGWVDDAVKIADLFLPKSLVAYTEMRDGSRENFSTKNAAALNIPVVVLVNEWSASASEILSGALQDYGAATIVGTVTYGKGVVLYVLPVGTRGAGMQVTAAQYFTPKGNPVHKIGITPDITAELPEDDDGMYELGDLNDPQLAAAYERVTKMIGGK